MSMEDPDLFNFDRSSDIVVKSFVNHRGRSGSEREKILYSILDFLWQKFISYDV